MANYQRQTLKYILDNGTETAIQVLYDADLDQTPTQRLEGGGFTLPDDVLACSGVLTRRVLQPRYVVVQTDDTPPKRIDVIVKDRCSFDAIIADPEITDVGIAKRYFGEQYTICA